MRIITGIYKGRHFDVPRTFKARPTTDFAKENIFNVLNGYIDLEDADALDLFAGTGSISLELVSRGCRHVTAVEADRAHHAFILRCLKTLGTDKCMAVRGDVFRYLKSCKRKYDFIFADPPYALPELPQIPAAVLDGVFLPTAASSCSSMARRTTSLPTRASSNAAYTAASTSPSSASEPETAASAGVKGIRIIKRNVL